MKKDLLEYKGYYGSYNVSVADEVFHGKIEFIRDLVTFEAESAKDLIQAFHESVEDYLKTCKQQGKKPDKPFKGSFNVRVGEDLHKKIATSLRENESINSFVVDAVKQKIKSVG